MSASWAEALPVLAARVAEDTGRDLAEVTERLDHLQRTTTPTDADVLELVDLLAPTMAKIIGPNLVAVLRRLEDVPADERMMVLAPIVVGLVPSVVTGVMLGMEASG